MSIYRFQYISDVAGAASVTVELDDSQYPCIDAVLVAFEQFLLGVTFQPESIAKYLDMEAVHRSRDEVAELVASYGGTTEE
jgi:hypothetical protein